MALELRDYQEEAVDTFFKKLQEGVTRQLITLPTGAGKTVVAASIALEFKRRFSNSDPILFIAHREELLFQTRSKFELCWDGVNVGLVKGKNNDQLADVITASTATLVRGRKLRQPSLVIYDEAHHARARGAMKVLRELGVLDGKVPLLGITATPVRGDNLALGEVFQEVVYEKSILDLVLAGYLSDIRGKRIKIDGLNLAGIKTTAGDYDIEALGHIMEDEDISDAVVSAYLEHGEGRKTVLFAVTVKQAQELSERFVAAGVPSAVVHGGMSSEERQAVLDAYEANNIRVLCNCQILTEGFDSPSTDCVLLARPTRSVGLYIQAIGRGTRLYPGKADVLVLDVVGASDDKSLVTLPNLFPELEEEEKESKKRTKKNESLVEHHQRVEDEKRAAEFRHKKVEQEQINLFVNRAKFHWSKIGEQAFVLTVDKGTRAFLYKQNARWWGLLNIGDKVVPVYGKPLEISYAQGLTEAFLQSIETALIKKDAPWRMETISPNQARLLFRYGIKDTKGWTKGQAQEKLNELECVKILETVVAKVDYDALEAKMSSPEVKAYHRRVLERIRRSKAV